ncbi:MAG: TerC/Alx family metal homeostasis membrane protein [Actinocrinis sp.]
MTFSPWVWGATLLGLLAVLALDLFVVGRRPHTVSMREAGLWIAAMAGSAVAFGLVLSHVAGPAYGGQFFAGWITEYSLSVDNLFVFVIIMARFRVPNLYQHRVLLIGVLLALAFRGVFIGAGSAVIAAFDWIFYLFGAFLIYTAIKLATSHNAPVGAPAHDDADGPARENGLVRFVRRFYPTVEEYHGTALTVRVGGRRALTPMALVILAIGATDVMFALDSIPAVFGLTQEPYIVFTANLFALLGLRQLYFLIGGLLDRLVYLSTGLSVVLGFIGVKMVVEALHGSGVEHLGPVALPTFSIPFSLGFILLTLATTTALSLTVGRRRALKAAAAHGSRD